MVQQVIEGNLVQLTSQFNQTVFNDIQTILNNLEPAARKQRIGKGFKVVMVVNSVVIDLKQTIGRILLKDLTPEEIKQYRDVPRFLFRLWREPTATEQRQIDRGSVPEPVSRGFRSTAWNNETIKLDEWQLINRVGQEWMSEHHVTVTFIKTGAVVKPEGSKECFWAPLSIGEVLQELQQHTDGVSYGYLLEHNPMCKSSEADSVMLAATLVNLADQSFKRWNHQPNVFVCKHKDRFAA